MTDKPTGPAAAAREICLIVHKSVRFVENPDDPELAAVTVNVTSEDIETIILKHYPEDKVGKLVEAARRVTLIAQVGRYPTIKDVEAWANAMIKLEAALADYEANK